MEPEEKAMLQKTLELSQENNKILQSIRRNMIIGRIFRIAYWVIIIGGVVGLYYYISPYIDSTIAAYGNVKGDLQSFGDLLR